MAETVVNEGRLDIPDSEISTLRANGRACVTVHEGGSVADVELEEQSFAAIQTGGSISLLKVGGESTAQVCGGNVGDATVGPNAILRATGGEISKITIDEGGHVHVYGRNLAKTLTEITGRWPGGNTFEIPLFGDGAGEGVVLHDTTSEPLPDSGLRAHYRLDESEATRTFDGTTFLHKAAGGNFVTDIPQHAPFPGAENTIPSVTTGAAPIASGTSARFGGGASATIEGHALPDFDSGATISFWFQQDVSNQWVVSLMSKAQPSSGGHPRSLALCHLPNQQFLVMNDFGVRISGPRLYPGRTYHTAITFTPTGGRTQLELFVDGVSYGTSSGAAEDRTDFDFRIGGWASSEAGIDGRIDDVQIYDRPLTSSEINKLHDDPGTTLIDLDLDSMLDDQEYAYFGTLRQPADGDFDGDGLTNLTELTTTRTAPDDFASKFAIDRVECSGPSYCVTFSSVQGVRYQLERSTDGGSSWHSRGGVITASNASTQLSDTSTSQGTLYRVGTR